MKQLFNTVLTSCEKKKKLTIFQFQVIQPAMMNAIRGKLRSRRNDCDIFHKAFSHYFIVV